LNRIRKTALVLTALAGWTGLILLMIVNLRVIRVQLGLSFLTAILRSFSFFTVLSTLLVTVSVTVLLLWPQRRAGRFFSRPPILSGFLVYIVVVGLVYHAALARIWSPQGLHLIADVLQHYVVPIFFLLHWLFIPKGVLRWRVVPAWLVFPAVYFGFALVRGAIADVYPYPFVNVSRLGIFRVLLNAAGFTLGFAVVGLATVVLDRLLGKTRLGRRPESARK
jgi:hypothetical protein